MTNPYTGPDWPATYPTGTVHGKFVDSNGRPQVGAVQLLAPVSAVTDLTSQVVVPTKPIIGVLDAHGVVSMTVPASDANNLSPTQWTYQVTEVWADGTGRTYSISVRPGKTTELATIQVEESRPGTTVVIGITSLDQVDAEITRQVPGAVASQMANYSKQLAAQPVSTVGVNAALDQLIVLDTTSSDVTVVLPAAPPDTSHLAVYRARGNGKVIINASGTDKLITSTGAQTLNYAPPARFLDLHYRASGTTWIPLGDGLTPYDTAASPSSVAVRQTGGQLTVAAPAVASDAATKTYVDGAAAGTALGWLGSGNDQVTNVTLTALTTSYVGGTAKVTFTLTATRRVKVTTECKYVGGTAAGGRMLSRPGVVAGSTATLTNSSNLGIWVNHRNFGVAGEGGSVSGTAVGTVVLSPGTYTAFVEVQRFNGGDASDYANQFLVMVEDVGIANLGQTGDTGA